MKMRKALKGELTKYATLKKEWYTLKGFEGHYLDLAVKYQVEDMINRLKTIWNGIGILERLRDENSLLQEDIDKLKEKMKNERNETNTPDKTQTRLLPRTQSGQQKNGIY